MREPYTYFVGIAVFLISLCLLSGCNFCIEINNEKLTVKKRGKIKGEYLLNECRIKAYTKTSFGETQCKLEVTKTDGRKETIDCDLIGQNNFYKLLEDLNVLGSNAEISNLETLKK